MKTNVRRSCCALFLLLVACSEAQHEDESWTALFDGTSLSGWVTQGGRYDGNARWTVEDGALTGRQNEQREGGLIYTETLYANFEFEVDVKIDWPFDSGIFLRMVPDEKGAQVTIDHREGGELGAIYSDGFLQHNEEGWKLFRKADWNHFRVICKGRDLAISVWCNGELLALYGMERNSSGYAPTGRIGLQVHGGENVPLETKVQFKNMRIRELELPHEPRLTRDDAGNALLSQSALIEGWRPLFDGKTLEGWNVTGPVEGVEVHERTIRVSSGEGELQTKADYEDFELHLDFQVGKLANSGVFLRAARDGSNPAFSGCEVQILDDWDWEQATNSKLAPWQFTGSLYGSVAPQVAGALKRAPEWNTYEITCRGARIRTLLNGQELYDVDTTSLVVPEGQRPFPERAKSGFIGLQRHSAAQNDGSSFVAFRNLFVKQL